MLFSEIVRSLHQVLDSPKCLLGSFRFALTRSSQPKLPPCNGSFVPRKIDSKDPNKLKKIRLDAFPPESVFRFRDSPKTEIFSIILL